jgi:hypothetical protein
MKINNFIINKIKKIHRDFSIYFNSQKNIRIKKKKAKNDFPISGKFNFDFTYKVRTSVIINYFTSKKTLLKSVSNLKNIKDIEIIIINDSGKNLNELSKLLPTSNDRMLISKDWGEAIGYRNGALLARASDYIIFSQDDDLAPEDNLWYKDCLREFKKNPKLGIIGLNGGGYFDEKDFSIIDYQKMKNIIYPIKKKCIWLKTGPLVIKKDVYDKTIGWRSFCKIGEAAGFSDLDLTLQVLKAGYTAMLLNNDNTIKWKRRFERDDGLTKEDLKSNYFRNKSFESTKKIFLLKNKKFIKFIQKSINK